MGYDCVAADHHVGDVVTREPIDEIGGIQLSPLTPRLVERDEVGQHSDLQLARVPAQRPHPVDGCRPKQALRFYRRAVVVGPPLRTPPASFSSPSALTQLSASPSENESCSPSRGRPSSPPRR